MTYSASFVDANAEGMLRRWGNMLLHKSARASHFFSNSFSRVENLAEKIKSFVKCPFQNDVQEFNTQPRCYRTDYIHNV